MNRLIALTLSVLMILSLSSCRAKPELETEPEDIRISFEEAEELYLRRQELFERAAGHIYKDNGGFFQTNQGDETLLQIDIQGERSDMRRILSNDGFEDEAIEAIVELLYEEQLQRITWNGDDTIYFYLYDGYSIICCSEQTPQVGGVLKDAHISSINNNWFFIEAVQKLI